MSRGKTVMLSWAALLFAVCPQAAKAQFSTFNVDGRAHGVAVSGHYLLVAVSPPGNYGLHVVDISNPATPVLVRTVSVGVSAFPKDVAVVGNEALVTVWGGGIVILDITDPVNPVVTSGIGACSQSPQDVELRGNLFAVCCPGHHSVPTRLMDGYLMFFDRTRSPQFVSRYRNEVSLLPSSVEIANSHAFVIWQFPGTPETELEVLDINDPSVPRVLSSYSGTRANVLEVVDNYLLLAGGSDGLQVLDVSDRTNPTFVASAPVPGAVFGHITIDSSLAFVSSGWSGLTIVNIDDITAPYVIGTFAAPYYVGSIAVHGGHVYVANDVEDVQFMRIDDVVPVETQTWGATKSLFRN